MTNEGSTNRQAGSALSASWLVARISLARLLKGRLTYGAMVLMALPLPGLVLLHSFGAGSKQAVSLCRSWLDLFLPLGTLLLSYGGVAEEVESGSAVYVWTSGRPRWILPMGKLLAGWILALVPGLALIMAGNVLAQMPVAPASLAAAVILSTSAYAALGLAAGALVPRHAMAAALTTGAVLNIFVVHIPGWAAVLSPAFHVHKLAGIAETPGKNVSKFFSVPDVSAATSALVLMAITVALASLAALRAANWEYRPRS